MARHRKRDLTVEEFDEWCEAERKVAETAQLTDERGGPRLTLVPEMDQEIAWPTDLLLHATSTHLAVSSCRSMTSCQLAPPPM